MTPGSEAFLVKTAVFGGLGLAIALGVRYAWSKAATAAPGALQAVGNAVNPLSTENLAYKGASAVTTAITGDDRPLGVQLFEWINPGTVLKEKQALYGDTTPELSSIAEDLYAVGPYVGPWAETPGGAATGRAIYRRR